jgi:hypothetical protein
LDPAARLPQCPESRIYDRKTQSSSVWNVAARASGRIATRLSDFSSHTPEKSLRRKGANSTAIGYKALSTRLRASYLRPEKPVVGACRWAGRGSISAGSRRGQTKRQQPSRRSAKTTWKFIGRWTARTDVRSGLCHHWQTGPGERIWRMPVPAPSSRFEHVQA